LCTNYTPFEDRDFNIKLNSTERRARKEFENNCRSFTGTGREESYNEILQQLILSYSAVGCNMSLKLHCLHSYSDFFMKTWEEHGKRFHRDISQIAKSYSGKGVQICWLSTAGVL